MSPPQNQLVRLLRCLGLSSRTLLSQTGPQLLLEASPLLLQLEQRGSRRMFQEQKHSAQSSRRTTCNSLPVCLVMLFSAPRFWKLTQRIVRLPSTEKSLGLVVGLMCLLTSFS